MSDVGCECEVCVPWEACMDCDANWDTLDPSLQCRATQLAWDTLKYLTGGRVGACPVTVRPCITSNCGACRGGHSMAWMNPVAYGDQWYNNICGGDDCSCCPMCEIVLPGPVAEVLEVSFHGAALPLSYFRVDNGNLFMRQDGGCWPDCQDMTSPLGQPYTFGITYVPGIKPNAAGRWAAGVLASEYAKACSGGKCRLPSGITSIARQGVVMEMSATMFPDGMTGIREVDAYVLSINPNGLKRPSVVFSPDLPQPRHRFQTWVAT